VAEHKRPSPLKNRQVAGSRPRTRRIPNLHLALTIGADRRLRHSSEKKGTLVLYIFGIFGITTVAEVVMRSGGLMVAKVARVEGLVGYIFKSGAVCSAAPRFNSALTGRELFGGLI